MTNAPNNNSRQQQQQLTKHTMNKENRHLRKASFDELEAAALSALLLDVPFGGKNGASPDNVLNADTLFMLPFEPSNNNNDAPKVAPRHRRPLAGLFVDLWRAYEDGVSPRKLARKASSMKAAPKSGSQKDVPIREGNRSDDVETEPEDDDASEYDPNKAATKNDDDDDDDTAQDSSVGSDKEVRPERTEGSDEDSSWAEDEGGFQHFDTWEVLKDEYAEDFGFGYTEISCSIAEEEYEDDDTRQNAFKIFGTSADDVSAQPHVLSPPLMDALMNFVPESLSSSNYWLKYSLVRDGASLDTLKYYCRASIHTILAIETLDGEVFGSYTSSPWRNSSSFFGSAPTFLWRMRNSRRTPCHCLFEQAQMESEIDVYFYSGLNDFVQTCSPDRITVGGGELVDDDETSDLDDSKNEGFGFGIALNDDLLSGTSSQCGTFRNPCLVKPERKGKSFEVANLEVWTFTPCADTIAAEKLEMTKYFLDTSVRSLESIGSCFSSRSNSIRDASLYGSSTEAPSFSSRDLLQQDFYRRIGERDQSEEIRERWHYACMMDAAVSGASRGHPTPRFTS